MSDRNIAVSLSSTRRLSSRDTAMLTIPLTEVGLNSLDPQRMKEMVIGLLYGDRQHSVDLRRVSELSGVLSAQTNGNPFFALHYLNYLSTIGLLNTTDGGSTWEWDLYSIDHQE